MILAIFLSTYNLNTANEVSSELASVKEKKIEINFQDGAMAVILNFRLERF